MKKYLKLMLVLVLAFIFVPIVKAQDLPTSGVTYFMMYPNGHEEVTESYSEASNPSEKLIYSGVTDQNGNIILEGWDRAGELRIVQHVPDGYTTNVREVRIDLSRDNEVSFVDYRGIVNPSTGASLLFIVVVVAVAGITVVARKNKKALMMIPIIIGIFMVVNVYAIDNVFRIQVKDGSGNALSGIRVDVYAKPTSIDAQPAVKFDANGGHFFDGTTVMYFRLPYEGCTVEELMNSLSAEEYDYWEGNSNSAYKSGYEPDGFDFPATLENGTVIPLAWYELSDEDDPGLIRVVGNGGTYNFYGNDLPEIVVPSYYANNYGFYFENGDSHFVGFDDNASCSHFNQYGISNFAGGSDPGSDFPKRSEVVTYYACWNTRPDGIYVNDEAVFAGGPSTCLSANDVSQYDQYSIGMYSSFNNFEYFFAIDQFNSSQIHFYIESYDMSQTDYRIEIPENHESIDGGSWVNPIITKIEIIKNGQVFVSLGASDLEEEDGSYYITNATKGEKVLAYFEQFDGCFSSGSDQG